MHPVHGIVVGMAVILMSLLQDLDLISSIVRLLLLHKIKPRSSLNPLRHYKIRSTNKTLTILLRAY
jgi:hypothetical protein